MYSQSQLYKAAWVIKVFRPGELQARTYITTPVKAGNSYNSPVFLRSKEIPGTGIPASTIARFQSSEYRLGEISIRKLSAFYDRYQYNNLRANGANKESSRKYAKYTPDKLVPILNQYDTWARNIQKNHRRRGRIVPLEIIKYGMAHSNHKKSEWDNLSLISGLEKVRLAPPQRLLRKKGKLLERKTKKRYRNKITKRPVKIIFKKKLIKKIIIKKTFHKIFRKRLVIKKRK